MIVTIQQFDDYSGNYEDSTSAFETKKMCLLSAENVVRDYLRYNPEEDDYTSYLSSFGSKRIQLPVRNARNITSVIINDITQNIGLFSIANDYLIYADRKTHFVFSDEGIVVSYTAGWSQIDMPPLIKETVLRIATLMLMEAGENIGVSSKSMPDSSRTFVSYTNYIKYLSPLRSYRIEVF